MSNHTGSVIVSTNALKAIACTICGYVHLDPLPTQAELDRLYADEYYQKHNAGWFEKERREQWYWEPVYWARLRQFEQIAGCDPGAFVFDWGAGCGWFVRATSKYTPEHSVLGFEQNKAALVYANEVGVSELVVDKIWVNPCSVDFVHACLVLEHLLNPLEFLKRAYASLKPGGTLCIVVPNEFNLYQCQLKNYTPVHAHHLNYFTPHSLKALCEKAGFEIVRHTSTFPMEWFALHGLNYIKYPRLGKVAHWLRMAIEWAGLSFAPERWECKRDEWAGRGVGREIELWVRKV